MELKNQIDEILRETYDEIPIYNITEPKVIHLTHIGTHNFLPHEMAIIDTPIIQRLRFISQLGPSQYVFPTARHSRFEHTLGVMIRVNQMYKSLIENQKISPTQPEKKKISNELRLAALLHDVGHGPFSHVCETVMLESKSVYNEKEKLKCKCHEALGYHIIRSEFLKPFFENIEDSYTTSIDRNEISNMIIGVVKNPENQQYKADLINGEFDADKLDYIIRDSYFSGVQLALGIDRFLLALGVDKIHCYDGKKNNKLILSEKGIMPMEQIIIAKIMLTGAIYHHQKVRAIDSMIIALLRRVLEKKPVINGIKIKTPLDFLRLDDHDLFRLKSKDEKIHELCKALKNRKTYKRALVISPKTIQLNDGDGTASSMFWDMIELAEKPEKLRRLNQELSERIGNGCTEYDIAIDFPKPPEIKETLQKVIKMHDHFVTIKDIFPQKGWIDAYIANKWVGHIFSNERYRKDAFIHGKEFLEEKFCIKFNENAEIFAKMKPIYKEQMQISDFIRSL